MKNLPEAPSWDVHSGSLSFFTLASLPSSFSPEATVIVYECALEDVTAWPVQEVNRKWDGTGLGARVPKVTDCPSLQSGCQDSPEGPAGLSSCLVESNRTCGLALPPLL